MNAWFSRHAAFDHCRALLPCFEFARGDQPFRRLRRLALATEVAGDPAGAPHPLPAAAIYLAVNLRQIWIAFHRHAAAARGFGAPCAAVQLLDLFHLSWRFNHSPHDYYLQKLWLRRDRRAWALYLQQREHVALVKLLRRSLPVDDFDDKLNLFRALRAAGVPTIDVLLAARGGRWIDGLAAGPHDPALRRDLVAKPTGGAMSAGVRVWRHDPVAGTFTRRTWTKADGPDVRGPDETLDLAGVLAQVLELSQKGTYIVQPRLDGAPDLDGLSPHSIANFRIVTAVREGRPLVASAILRLGYDPFRFRPSTYQAPIDLETGVLGVATGRLEQFGHGPVHIETGAPVTGVRLARWPEMKALALRAHAVFPWMPLIGWDVVDTENGPLIMEANACWGADIAQVGGPVLGEAGYAEAFWEAYARAGAVTGPRTPRAPTRTTA